MKEYYIVSDLVSQAAKKREQYIIDRLRDLGHTFENNKDLSEFAKKRLTKVITENAPDREFYYLDGHIMIAAFNTVPVYNKDTGSWEL